jgi:ABC-type Fe3+-hydroxamate transport system substrate-binding protein
MSLGQKNKATKRAAEWDEKIERVIDEIRFRLEDVLQLDPRTVAYIYEYERGDNRFRLAEMGEGEFFMEMCGDEEKRSCVEVGLTTSEAIALALRLIRYAAKAYARDRGAVPPARSV